MKRVSVLVALSLSVVLAQEVTDYAGVDPSGQSVTFWHNHTDEREELLDEIVAEFNSTNEYGITVTASNQGDYGDIFQKMLPLLNTEEAPDLVVAYQNQAATYQLADALIDMTPLVNDAEWGLSEAALTDFFPSFLNQDVFPTFDNARLGFPPNRSMEVMYYNADWLAELGFDGPPETPEQFREMACAAAQTPFSGASGEGASTGYELDVADASRFASWTFAFGGDIFDYDANQYTLNSEAALAATNFLQGLIDDGCATVVTEQYGDQTDFGAGRTLFTTGSSSGLPFYGSAVDEGAAFSWSVAAVPHTTPEPVQNVYGASVSMPVHTPERQLAAWLFLKHFTSPEVQARWAGASGYFPVRESVAEGLGDYFEANPAYEAAFQLLPYGTVEPSVPGYEFVRSLLEETVAAITDGDNVEEALADANEEANQILAEQLEQLEASN